MSLVNRLKSLFSRSHHPLRGGGGGHHHHHGGGGWYGGGPGWYGGPAYYAYPEPVVVPVVVPQVIVVDQPTGVRLSVGSMVARPDGSVVRLNSAQANANQVTVSVTRTPQRGLLKAQPPQTYSMTLALVDNPPGYQGSRVAFVP